MLYDITILISSRRLATMALSVILTSVEARVLGSLVEKELTTPDYYPLSLNALTLACNQKTSRDPLMELSEKEVLTALDSLRSQQLAWQRTVAGARVLKYEHNLTGRWTFGTAELATLCLLLLRGPQTAGEIKSRSGRMHDFQSLSDVDAALQKLMTMEDGPFICKLPRAAGHKESRFAHLFCGPVEAAFDSGQETQLILTSGGDRISMLESQVRELIERMDLLSTQFANFRKQFE